MRKVVASYYEELEGDRVKCLLCPHHCVISSGNRGSCRARANDGGTLFSLSYGNTVTVNIDPIEKKPLFHFMPGSRILSVGPNGCTLTCKNCQNWSISQEDAATSFLPPSELIDLAAERGLEAIAFTYTEPLVWFEYLTDVLPDMRKKGIKSVLVTNGYLNEEPAAEIAPMVDAFNIDMKSFEDSFYRDQCGGSVEPVKRFVEIAAAYSHVELTNLLIPGLNDAPAIIEDMAEWISSISREIPLHFSRFFPHYRMSDRPPTPPETLQEAYEIGRRYLDYVYVGNIFIDGTENTYCPECGEVVVHRTGYSAKSKLKNGLCPECGTAIKGVWS